MSTAEQIRLQQLAAYWRVREQQLQILEGYLVPVAKLLGEKLREVHPEWMTPPAKPPH
jgi:hypothetical protein